MTGLRFLAVLVATGKMKGVGIGSSVAEVDETLGGGFIWEVDEDSGSLRRDYGALELSFSPGPDHVLTGGVVEVHRLAEDSVTREEAHRELDVDFPAYVAWAELAEELKRTPGSPELKTSSQGEFLEHRAAATRVSVHVVDNDEERDTWPGHGDVWSVSLG